ncbi:MAG: SWIM zinc finger family protein [Firmicutes bacterium]|nr:SWIM zinc finger family protein [Bacillota bacterium]
MRLIYMSNGKSVLRGLDYCIKNKVKNYKKISDYEYEGIVRGSNNREYNVFMDIKHPIKSKCNCPHANDRRIICKHIVSLYFTVFPEELTIFLEKVKMANQEFEDYENKLYEKTIKYIHHMSKKELRKALIDILDISPNWVYKRFVRDRIGDS